MNKKAFTILELTIVIGIMLAMVFFVYRYVGKNSDSAKTNDGLRHEFEVIIHNAQELKKDNAWGTYEDMEKSDFVSYFPNSYNPKLVNNEYVEIDSVVWRYCKYQIKHNVYGESMTYRVFVDCSNALNLNPDDKAVIEAKSKSFFTRIQPDVSILMKAKNIDGTDLSGNESDGMILINNIK